MRPGPKRRRTPRTDPGGLRTCMVVPLLSKEKKAQGLFFVSSDDSESVDSQELIWIEDEVDLWGGNGSRWPERDIPNNLLDARQRVSRWPLALIYRGGGI